MGIDLPFLQLPRNSQKHNTFHFYGRCRSSGICLWSNPTIWEYCQVWRPGYTFHLVRISQNWLADCHRRWASSDIGHWPCPRCDRGHHNWSWRLRIRHDWNAQLRPDLSEPVVSSNTCRCAHPKYAPIHQNCRKQLDWIADWNYSRTHSYCVPSGFLDICRNSIPTLWGFYRRCRWPKAESLRTKPHPRYRICGRIWSFQICHRKHPIFWSIYRPLNT